MNRTDNDLKRRIAKEILVILGVLALLTFVTKLWPILLGVCLGILVCAMKLLFTKAKTVEPITPVVPPLPEPIESEQSIVGKAFGLLQRRITEQVASRYPGARWVWGNPNPMEHFRHNEPLLILLNGAGGYNKAQVLIGNLMFVDLRWGSLEEEAISSVKPVRLRNTESPEDADDVSVNEFDSKQPDEHLTDDMPVNYERLAFEWVDASMNDLSTRFNEAIAENRSEMLIPADELPHPDSHADVCAELKRNGFADADFREDGICVKITQ